MSSRDSDEQEDELESEIDDDFDELRSDKDEPEQVSASKLGSGKLVPFDPVNVPKGDKTKFERFVSFRTSEGAEELLVKYKVPPAHTGHVLPAMRLGQKRRPREGQNNAHPRSPLHAEADMGHAVLGGRTIQSCLCKGTNCLNED
jgi:hypothetical protein